VSTQLSWALRCHFQAQSMRTTPEVLGPTPSRRAEPVNCCAGGGGALRTVCAAVRGSVNCTRSPRVHEQAVVCGASSLVRRKQPCAAQAAVCSASSFTCARCGCCCQATPASRRHSRLRGRCPHPATRRCHPAARRCHPAARRCHPASRRRHPASHHRAQLRPRLRLPQRLRRKSHPAIAARTAPACRAAQEHQPPPQPGVVIHGTAACRRCAAASRCLSRVSAAWCRREGL